jgi:hypothetical protein
LPSENLNANEELMEGVKTHMAEFTESFDWGIQKTYSLIRQVPQFWDYIEKALSKYV